MERYFPDKVTLNFSEEEILTIYNKVIDSIKIVQDSIDIDSWVNDGSDPESFKKYLDTIPDEMICVDDDIVIMPKKLEIELVELHTKFDKETFTIFGCGKFHETHKHLSKAQAALLLIELYKFLEIREEVIKLV